jgi:hypothetical protein
MRVGPSMWNPPSCEGLLYSCCIGVVNLTFSYKYMAYVFYLHGIIKHRLELKRHISPKIFLQIFFAEIL